MWSHLVVVGVGSTAVVVGTDAPEVLELLAPWQIDDFDDSQIELVDYGVGLHAERTGPKGPKPLHRLARGSCNLIGSRDPERITQALLQSLATHAKAARPGTMRIELAPVMRDGDAVLAPVRGVLPISERWLEKRGMTRFDTVSSILDPDSMTVEFDEPLGSIEAHAPLQLTGWFLPLSGVDEVFTPGRAVAQAMGLTIDVLADNAAWHLEQLAHGVKQLPPRVAPVTPADWKTALHGAFND